MAKIYNFEDYRVKTPDDFTRELNRLLRTADKALEEVDRLCAEAEDQLAELRRLFPEGEPPNEPRAA